jgi:hypothetical protein
MNIYVYTYTHTHTHPCIHTYIDTYTHKTHVLELLRDAAGLSGAGGDVGTRSFTNCVAGVPGMGSHCTYPRALRLERTHI